MQFLFENYGFTELSAERKNSDLWFHPFNLLTFLFTLLWEMVKTLTWRCRGISEESQNLLTAKLDCHPLRQKLIFTQVPKHSWTLWDLPATFFPDIFLRPVFHRTHSTNQNSPMFKTSFQFIVHFIQQLFLFFFYLK